MDKGTEFFNKLLKHTAQVMGFKCEYSAGYTPLAQAVVEKLNAVIVKFDGFGE